MLDVSENEDFNRQQHCTFEAEADDNWGDYSFSHTAEYCGRTQPRACGCPYCYSEGVADLINCESFVYGRR